MSKHKRISRNIYQEGKNSFRVRFEKKGKTTSKSFPTKSDALAFRLKKLGF